MKITIEHEGKIWQGDLRLRPGKESHKPRYKSEETTNTNLSTAYSKKSPAESLYLLKHKHNFFADDTIRTTQEIIDQIKIKLNRVIRPKNAVRNFYALVNDGELDRDKIPPSKTLPKGAYIWFLPTISKEKVGAYKKNFKT